MLSLTSLLPFVFAAVASAKIYTSPSQLPTTTFDYVVVGGGTAGNVIANRLSELANVQVLVLEAGQSYQDVLGIQLPLLPSGLIQSAYDWAYLSTPQSGLGGLPVYYARGKVLGGSSATNFMIYNHPNQDDWDAFALRAGSPGLSWNLIQPYIKKHERFVVKAGDSGKYIPTTHGFDGKIGTSLPAFSLKFDSMVLNALNELPAEFKYNPDVNSGKSLGVGWLQSTVANGERQHSGNSYLSPEFVSRSNLHVLVGAHVNTVAQSTKTTPPTFNVVNYVADGSSTVLQVNAKKEIILSTGAIGTPKLLLLSGIGPKADLDALKIPVIIDNEDVGAGLEDHPNLPLFYEVKESVGNDAVLTDPTSALGEWLASKTGPVTNGINNHMGFFRLPSNSTIFQTVADPSPGKNAPHYELLFGTGFLGIPQPTSGSHITVTISFLTALSRGSIKLASSDPADAPLINPDLLAHPFDLFTMKEAIKKAQLFLSANTFKDLVIGPAGSFAGALDSDAATEAFIRGATITTGHPASTARMTGFLAKDGVVNPDFKVKGANGLRIVDASVFPFVPTSHPVGAVYIYAELAADYIKGVTS